MTVTVEQLERDLEDTREDLRRAERELDISSRALDEGRVTNREGWERTLAHRRRKVYRLKGEARLLEALLEDADLASSEPGPVPAELTNGEGRSDA